MARKKTDFEKSLAELETLVQQMESGRLSLEDSLKAFERGIRLTRECQQALAQAEQKVQLLLADGDDFTLEELETEDDDDE
jgi:exodeoxyribonuclease VII small subunit